MEKRGFPEQSPNEFRIICHFYLGRGRTFPITASTTRARRGGGKSRQPPRINRCGTRRLSVESNAFTGQINGDPTNAAGRIVKRKKMNERRRKMVYVCTVRGVCVCARAGGSHSRKEEPCDTIIAKIYHCDSCTIAAVT